jgi:hypothetical protein
VWSVIPFWFASCADTAAALSKTVSSEETRRLQIQLAGLDLREIEDAIDDRRERFGRGADRLHVHLTTLAKIGSIQQFGSPDDGRKRGAQLMTHRRDKLCLEL